MTHLGLILAIADQMQAEGWQERTDSERVAEAARRLEDAVGGRVAPPWAKARQEETHTRLRKNGQYEMVFDG